MQHAEGMVLTRDRVFTLRSFVQSQRNQVRYGLEQRRVACPLATWSSRTFPSRCAPRLLRAQPCSYFSRCSAWRVSRESPVSRIVASSVFEVSREIAHNFAQECPTVLLSAPCTLCACLEHSRDGKACVSTQKYASKLSRLTTRVNSKCTLCTLRTVDNVELHTDFKNFRLPLETKHRSTCKRFGIIRFLAQDLFPALGWHFGSAPTSLTTLLKRVHGSWVGAHQWCPRFGSRPGLAADTRQTRAHAKCSLVCCAPSFLPCTSSDTLSSSSSSSSSQPLFARL